MGHPTGQPVAGYPSKGAAAWGLHKLGKTNDEIAKLTGSTSDAVKTAIRVERKKAGEPAPPRRPSGPKPGTPSKRQIANQHQPDATPGKWTLEKKAKVRRLYGLTLIEIAKAVKVKPAELLTYVIHGIEPGTRAIGADGAIAWRDDEQLQLSPPADEPGGHPTNCKICGGPLAGQYFMCDMEDGAWCPACFEGSACGKGKHGEGCATAVFDVPDFVDVVPEPDRNDDEAELAALAAAYVDDPEAAYQVLQMAAADVTREQVASWTREQRHLAEEWAGAVHLHASDNDDVVVPPRPEFIAGFRILGDRHPITRQPSPEMAAALQEIAGTTALVREVTGLTSLPAREVAPPAQRFQPTPAPAGPVANPVAGGTRLPTSGLFPAGRMVRLVREDGKYLHQSLDGFTKDLAFAWDGPRQQFDAVKAQMPKIVARLMFEVVA